MSDLSIAKGLITVSMVNKKALLDFISIGKKALELTYYSTTLELFGECEYSIEYLLSPLFQEKIDRELLEYNERTKRYSLTLTFTGLGKYAYENTIKRVFSTIYHYISLSNREGLIETLNTLEEEKIILSFDFNDMVESSNHLSKNRIVVAKPAGQPLEDSRIDYLHHSEIMMEYSARNLKNIMGYNCFGTEPEFLHLLVDGLIHICEEDGLPVDEYQALIDIRQLNEIGQLSLALREDIAQEIAIVSGDADIVIIDNDDLDPLRNSDLREVICDYWASITRLEKLAV